MASRFEVVKTSWNYHFESLKNFEDNKALQHPGLRNYFSKTQPLFDKIAERWSSELHSEWLLRQYLALKYIMAASIQIGSADHAYTENLQMAVPYLTYYAMFNSVRANLLMSPRIQWGKNTLTISHDSARESFDSELRLLACEEEAKNQIDLFLAAKHGRELSSYKFPASGAPGSGGLYVYIDKAESFARLASELALFNSFCLCDAIDRKFGPDTSWAGFDCDPEILKIAFEHKLKNGGENSSIKIMDGDDKYRVKKMAKQIKKPLPFIWLIGEGGVEDFFGSYASTLEDGNGFDPDEHWDRLLNLP